MANKDSDFKKLEDAVEVLHRLSTSTEKIDLGLWRAASNFALDLNSDSDIGDPDELFKSIEKKTDTLIKFGRLKSRLARAGKVAHEITSESVPAEIKGSGALSNDKLWSVMGWKEHRPGEFVWSRPPNVSFRGRFPQTQATAYVANYEASPSGFALNPQDTMLPVTTAQAKEMREQDAMWARIEAAKQSAISRQMKIAMAAEDKRRQQEANVRAEMMDPHERFIYENTERFGKAGAEQVFRQRLLKELPPFFKDSKLSTKTLIGIQKTIASAKGIPLVGKLMHPAALGFAALGLADAYMRSSSAANREVTGWSTSRSITGSPSPLFDKMARLAGAEDEASVLKMYSTLLEKFGTEEAFPIVGQMLRGTPKGIVRLSAMKENGLDDRMANLLMYMAGEQPIGTTKESQETSSRLSRLRDIQTWGLRSGSSIMEKLRGASLWLFGEKELEARGTSWMDAIEGGMGPAGWGSMLMRKIFRPTDEIDSAIEKQIESESAAESYDSYESSGGNTTNNSVSSTNSAIYINNMNVNGDNAMEVVRGIEDIADRTLGSRANVLNAMDSRVAV